MPDLFPRLAKYVAIRKTHVFVTCEQALSFLAGQSQQHAINYRNWLRRGRQISVLHYKIIHPNTMSFCALANI